MMDSCSRGLWHIQGLPENLTFSRKRPCCWIKNLYLHVHLTFKQMFNNNIFHIISSSLHSLKCFMPVMTRQSLGVNSVWSCIMLNVYLTLWGPLLWSTHREGVELDKGVESLTTWKSLLSRSESSFWSSSWGNFQLILMMISFFTSGTHIWWKETDAHPQNNLWWSVPL